MYFKLPPVNYLIANASDQHARMDLGVVFFPPHWYSNVPAGLVTANYADQSCSRWCRNPEIADVIFMSVLKTNIDLSGVN